MRTAIIVSVVLFGAPGMGFAQRPAAAQPSASFRGFVVVNGGYQAASNDFNDSATFRENAEEGRFDTDYAVESGPAFDIAGGATVWRQLGVGVGVTRYSRATPVALSGTVPHPFFFSRARPVNGDVSGLKREELAVHLQARGIVPVGPRFQVMVFGGPSFFQVKQGVVTDFDYTETYPYDSAAFQGAQSTEAKESKVGFNVGGDLAFFFTRQIGVGFSAQFSGVDIDLPSASGGTKRVKAGGAQAGGGLRLRF